MEWYFILLICIAAAVALVAALAAAAYRIAFGRRCDKNPYLTYFTAEHFGLDYKKVEIKVKKNILRGALYRKGDCAVEGLVIFCHGMGAGHAAYMTEIDCFCGLGYLVLAVDNCGCDLSDGKNIRGLYSGVETAKAAYDFAKGNEELKNLKTFFVGHSWGGYSALCAAAERDIDGAVALSAPLSPVQAVSSGAAGVLPKWIIALLRPFLALCDFFVFGVHSNKNAAKCAKKCKKPVLLVHGDCDRIVPLSQSAYAKAEGENITKYLAEGRAHNPYNTVEAQAMMNELSSKLASIGGMSEEERAYFSRFDYVAATREDVAVMDFIMRFMKA